MMKSTADVSRAPARAFTLVEVLVGILILGLGLLGLGAIYPAVAIQQRGAGDAVEGQATAEAAEAFLRGSAWLNRRSVPPASSADNRVVQGWEAALLDDDGGRGDGWASIEDAATSMIVLDNATGDLTIGAGSTGQGYEFPVNDPGFVTIPVEERLVPRAAPGAERQFGNARFVWDAVARRVPRSYEPVDPSETDLQRVRRLLQDSVQVAVFVRRIDSGIRYREGVEYVPVAQAENGLATLDGFGDNGPNYAPIRLMELEIDDDAFPNGVVPPNAMIRYVHLSMNTPISPGMTDESMNTAIAQVGQKFVLENGTVVTVTGVRQDENNPDRSILRIDPEVPAPSFIRQDGTEGIAALFTAQTPVAVRVFTLRDEGVN